MSRRTGIHSPAATAVMEAFPKHPDGIRTDDLAMIVGISIHHAQHLTNVLCKAQMIRRIGNNRSSRWVLPEHYERAFQLHREQQIERRRLHESRRRTGEIGDDYEVAPFLHLVKTHWTRPKKAPGPRWIWDLAR